MVGLSNADAEAARQILNDIDNHQFKHALTKVDRKLKKTDSDYFKALQALIKAHIGHISDKNAILLQLEELVSSKRVLKDLDAIQIYDETLELILPNSGETWARIIGYLRLELVKAMPKDADASRACFRACLAKEDYEHARQIANSLEKNFPSSHEYVFWNIATMFLYSRSQSYPEKDRKLYGALSEGLIRKLADATIKAADSSLPTRSIHQVQEFLLMDTILKNGDPGKMNTVRLNYLHSPYLGPESTIAKGEWQLWRLKLELLKKDPEVLFQMTGDLLKKARTKNKAGEIAESRFSDWIVWESYIDTALRDKPKYQDQVDAEIKAHLDPKSRIDKSWRRNASLASLKFSLAPDSAFLSSGAHDSKTGLVLQYLQQYGDTNVAYTDLRTVIPLLASQDLDSLLQTLLQDTRGTWDASHSGEGQSMESVGSLNQQAPSEITKLVNVYKLIFLITSSLPESRRRVSNSHLLRGNEPVPTCSRCSTKLSDEYCGSCITNIAWAAIKAYYLAINDDGHITSTLLATDIHPADDLAILAATCLAKLSMKSGSLRAGESLDSPAVFHLLQAAVLLEYAWSRSKSNSQISLMLTSIYYSLGCGSLAMRAYQRLGVKQIQNATLSHYMFDGISTFHPHPFTSDDSFPTRSVVEQLRDQQRIYKTAPKQISNKIWSSFEHNNYNTIFELEEVKEALAYNVSAVMSVIEGRKVSRLVQPSTPLTASSCGYDILPLDIDDPKTNFSDQNDYKTMPNFEVLGEEAPLTQLERLQVRVPLKDRLHHEVFSDKIRMIVDPIADPVSKNSAQAWLDQNLDSTYEKEVEGGEFYATAKIIQGVSAFEDDLQSRLSNRLREIAGLGSASAPATRGVLHSLYVAYDVGTTVLRLNAYLTRTKPETKLQASFGLAEQLVKAVIQKATMIKQSLDEGGWIDKVLKSVFQGDIDVAADSLSIPGTLKGVVDENFMEEWAGQVVDSWKDSVKGFAYFRS